MTNYDTLPEDPVSYKKNIAKIERTQNALLTIDSEISHNMEIVKSKLKTVEEIRQEKRQYFDKIYGEVQIFLEKYQNTNGAYKQQFIILRTIAQGIIGALDENGFMAKEPVAAALPAEAIPVESEESKLTLDDFFQ